MTKNKAGSLVALGLCMIVILACSRFGKVANEVVTKPLVEESKTFTLNGKEWNSFELDQTDVKAEFPGKPVDKTPPLPASFRAVFSSMRIHSYDEKDFQSSVTQLVPTGNRKFQVKELADTSMAAMKRQIPDLTYTLDIESESKAKYNGSFTKNGKTYDVRGCCIYKKGPDPRVWAVITLYPTDNADARTAGQRIIDSVVFKGATDECK